MLEQGLSIVAPNSFAKLIESTRFYGDYPFATNSFKVPE